MSPVCFGGSLGGGWWECVWGGRLWGPRSIWGSPRPGWAEEMQESQFQRAFSRGGGADCVHTLTCAITLLNTDLHGQVRAGGSGESGTEAWAGGQGGPWGPGEGSE